MAHLLQLKTFSDKRGNLTVIEKELPFKVPRLFYIYGVDDSVRGGHRHHKTRQAAICVAGKCIVSCHDGKEHLDFALDHPSKCLIIEPEDYHTMHHFTPDAVLVVLASELFDPTDYIYEDYPS
ncbi:MAG TPA: FdtA/QdtA family cupin domain-containing protein [Bacteroidota bacterium]|nr:FdtA/QdtA family cupin domain-containing protein [Bacteroidota bacterium]